MLTEKFTFSNEALSQKTKKRLKITGRLLNLLIRGALSLNGIADVKELFGEVENTAKTAIDTTTILLCFDDLERKSPNLSIEDLTGYVNSLVEENTKILLICNEDQIEKEKFNLYKEKVVGIQQEYHPTPTQVISNILTRYTATPTYYDYLLGQMELLVELYEKNGQNFRHLIYALDFLSDIHQEIEAKITETSGPIFHKIAMERNRISKFALICSIEFKAPNLSFRDISKMNILPDQSIYNDETKAIPDTHNSFKYDQLKNKYYPGPEEYIVFKTIFLAATGGADFSIEQFTEEFQHYFTTKTPSREDEVFSLLKDWRRNNVSEKEYKSLTRELLRHALKGKYKLTDYITIQYFIERYDNLVGFDLKKTNKDLLKAMHKIEFAELKRTFEFESQEFYSEGCKRRTYFTQRFTQG
ncbi:MAG: hypothetical protein KA821_07110 [Chitinophagaceae bacterium]|nr:hypothetical protein [Chitinophagaceae bacterium]